MASVEIVDIINSIEDAEDYWIVELGHPDYLSKPEDITMAQSKLSEYVAELDVYERRIKNMHVDNLNHYVINKTIALHFIVEAGQTYIEKLNNVIYNTMMEKELEKAGYIKPELDSFCNN